MLLKRYVKVCINPTYIVTFKVVGRSFLARPVYVNNKSDRKSLPLANHIRESQSLAEMTIDHAHCFCGNRIPTHHLCILCTYVCISHPTFQPNRMLSKLSTCSSELTGLHRWLLTCHSCWVHWCCLETWIACYSFGFLVILCSLYNSGTDH